MLNEIIINSQKIHTRDIQLATYPHNNGQIVVHGVLIDKRCISVFDVDGERKSTGIIHHLDVKLLIAPDPLRIELAEAEMLHVPMEECHATLERVADLKGIEIRAGFSRNIRKIMGGKTGCTHLCHLVTVMGQEIVHGSLTQKHRDRSSVPKDLDSLNESEFLIDSCLMWTKNGPRMNQLKQAIEKRKSILASLA